jgi:hypothetical protein
MLRGPTFLKLLLFAGATAKFVVHCPDTTNCTSPIQQAFDDVSLDTVVIPSTGEAWQTEPLFIRRSNFTVVVSSGAELVAKQGSFHGTNDCLLSFVSVTNVSLLAKGATMRMRKLDYVPPAYTKAEWRMALKIVGSRDVRVIGGTYKDAGGDGIYIAAKGALPYSSDILIQEVIVDGAWRNGLSVISAVNLTVRDSTFSNTNGTNPQCGIDLEPDLSTHRLQGITFLNTTLSQNMRCGFTMGPYALINSTYPLDVTIKGMRIHGVPGSTRDAGSPKPLSTAGGQGLMLSDGYKLSGLVRIEDINISNTFAEAVSFANWPSGFIDTSFAGLNIRNSTLELQRSGFDLSPIVILPTGSTGKDSNASLPAGGVRFDSTTVSDGICRPWLSCLWDGTHGHSTPPSLVNISGDVVVFNSKAKPGCPADFGKTPTGITVRVTCNP